MRQMHRIDVVEAPPAHDAHGHIQQMYSTDALKMHIRVAESHNPLRQPQATPATHAKQQFMQFSTKGNEKYLPPSR